MSDDIVLKISESVADQGRRFALADLERQEWEKQRVLAWLAGHEPPPRPASPRLTKRRRRRKSYMRQTKTHVVAKKRPVRRRRRAAPVERTPGRQGFDQMLPMAQWKIICQIALRQRRQVPRYLQLGALEHLLTKAERGPLRSSMEKMALHSLNKGSVARRP